MERPCGEDWEFVLEKREPNQDRLWAGGGEVDTVINVFVTLPTDSPALVEQSARTGVRAALRERGMR